MTVSWKRLIAFVALVAITLAGTPTKAVANDGLKSERYGFKSTQQQVQEVAQARANIHQNPFRSQTVTATLSGSALTIDRSQPARNSVAILMPGTPKGTTNESLAMASRNANAMMPIAEIRGAVFSNQRGFYGSMTEAGRSAIDVAGHLYDAAIENLSLAAVAERNFSNSVTGMAMRQSGIAPVRPASLTKPAFAPFKLTADANLVKAKEESSSSINNSKPKFQLSSAVIRNIVSESTNLVPVTRKLKRPSGGNISIMVIESADSAGNGDPKASIPGKRLLIDRYVPCNLNSDGPARL